MVATLTLVHGFPKQNAQAVERFTCAASPDSESGRILLYICPECGDIGCGAYSAFIEHGGGTYVWRDFAYENLITLHQRQNGE